MRGTRRWAFLTACQDLTPSKQLYTLRLSCPPGAASAMVPPPRTIASCICGLLTFFQVTGPCFTPAGTNSAEVLSKMSGSPPTTNSISPPGLPDCKGHSLDAVQPRYTYHVNVQKYEDLAQAFRIPSPFQDTYCFQAQVHYS